MIKGSTPKRWGIIGDGQLARMLALEAYTLGIKPVLLTGDPTSPAGQVCPLQVRGQLNSVTDLHTLLSQVDNAIIESEFVNCDSLESTGHANKVIPNIKCIRTLQNKLEQKKILLELSIPTSPLVASSVAPDPSFLDSLTNHKKPLVLKFATLGYDGKGVCVLAGDASDRDTAKSFCELALDRKIQVYAEERIDFGLEVAMVSARSKNGSIAHYPLVITEQSNGVCKNVRGPAIDFGCGTTFEKMAKEWSKKIADHLDLVGCFAVEFFVTKDEQLLVNEIAPRVHNSGHFTQDFSRTSQFLNHWLAVSGHDLGSTESHGLFHMRNLLGPAGLFSKETLPTPAPSKEVKIHWYQKAGVSPGRKLGHLITGAKDHNTFNLNIAAIDKIEKSWTSHVTNTISTTSKELLK